MTFRSALAMIREKRSSKEEAKQRKIKIVSRILSLNKVLSQRQQLLFGSLGNKKKNKKRKQNL